VSQDTIPLLSSEIDNIISIIESFNDSGLTHLDFTLGDLRIKIDKGETLSAELLTFATKSGENIVIVRSGTKPADFRVSLP